MSRPMTRREGGLPQTTSLMVAVVTAALTLAAGLGTCGAAATAAITLNKTEFKAGDTLTVGVQVTNPPDSPAANLYLGVVMPDGQTALFLVPGGATAPVSLGDPANFRSLQSAPPGFTLNAPAFSQFTWPADGLPVGTYQLFVALAQASNGAVLALDVKPFTYSPRNVFLPLFARPFDGDFDLSNWFDHNVPFEFVDNNGVTINFAGETSPFGIDGHNGYDFRMSEGTPLRAVANGTVTFAGTDTPFACPVLGNQMVAARVVTVRHSRPGGQTIDSGYVHLSRVDVQVGQQVVAGQQIGLSGNTGCSTAPHLHFNTFRVNGGLRTRIDPFGWDAPQADPWALHAQGAQSLYLWLPGQAPAIDYRPRILAPNCGTPATCGSEPVTITRLKAAGVRDDLNPNNEFVELTLDTRFNAGDTSRSLTGYTIRNLAGDTYTFPNGTVLSEGQSIRIYSGAGVNGSAVLFWGRSQGAWNNFADCPQLFDPTGVRRYRLSYNGAC
jgi:murein DD-endopeptidase MepM/ murein hydrolase activator NlpD